jgi:hypothetical protein
MVARAKFLLQASLIFILLVCFGAYFITPPYHVVSRIDCGEGRYVELLRPNRFCDVGGPIHFRFSGMTPAVAMPSVAIWDCGDTPELVVLPGIHRDIIAWALADGRHELLMAVDFGSAKYWPDDWHRRITTEAELMLGSVRAQQGQVWLRRTYDGRFTKPRP